VSIKYKIITCSQDSRYPQDLVLTLRFEGGEAPDAGPVICLVEDALDLLAALQHCEMRLTAMVGMSDLCADEIQRSIDVARSAITKARGES
jgi:hypothetical protein